MPLYIIQADHYRVLAMVPRQDYFVPYLFFFKPDPDDLPKLDPDGYLDDQEQIPPGAVEWGFVGELAGGIIDQPDYPWRIGQYRRTGKSAQEPLCHAKSA